MSFRRSLPLNRHCDGVATAKAQACDTTPGFAPYHFMNQSDQNPGSGCSNRMAEGNRTAVDVHLLRRKTELFHDGDGLYGKRFIEFEKIHALHCPSSFNKQFLN